MLLGLNTLNPVVFKYEHDKDLTFNQKTFATQQGLALNAVNALSGCKDEVIQNYSNIYLTGLVKVNDVLEVAQKQEIELSFPSYIALSAYPNIGANTQYISVSSNEVNIESVLDNSTNVYFNFQDIGGVKCRIYKIFDDAAKCLTVNLPSLSCSFVTDSSANLAAGVSIFEYTLDNSGYLKLYFRNNNQFYSIGMNGNVLSAVNVSVTPSTSANIFATTWRGSKDTIFNNSFVYYEPLNLKEFTLNENKGVADVEQNLVLYYNYDSEFNFTDSAEVYVDFYKTKNILSNNYYINDKLPFKRGVIQREYSSILSKQHSEKFAGNLQLNYNFYTKEYLFKPDVATKFTLPETIYPYSQLNIDDSGLVHAGSYGGQSPVFSDKVTKQLNLNENTVAANEANGTYLYTWLYTNSNLTTAYWVDRYYYPKKTSILTAFSGTNNQIFNYTSSLSAFLQTNYAADDFLYYDIRSSLVFEASATYYYSRIGNKYISKVVDQLPVALSSFTVYNNTNTPQYEANEINFGNTYGLFKVSPVNGDNSFSTSFNFKCNSLDDVKTNLIIGNNFDEGLSLYKGGIKNIFTPGYILNTLTGVEMYNNNNEKVFAINISEQLGTQAEVLDIINTGFDHIIKIFYTKTNSNIPGFLDFSIHGNILNIYEFADLVDIFATGQSVNVFNKIYVGTSQIWYLVQLANGSCSLQKFDYANNEYLGQQVIQTKILYDYNSVVRFNETLQILSGYRGQLLENSIGVSKLHDTVYFKELSTNAEYPALSTVGGSVFDIDIFNNKIYVQTNDKVTSYDKYKNVHDTYTLNASACSGLKIDFINENYKTKLVSYSTNNKRHVIVDKFDLESATIESTFDTQTVIDSAFFGELHTPQAARYTSFNGIGVINSSFVSGGIENAYTYSTPIIESLTAIPLEALLVAVPVDTNPTSVITGTVTTYQDTMPNDIYVNLLLNGTTIATNNSTFGGNKITVTYTGAISGGQYTLLCARTTNENLVVNLQLDITNNSFSDAGFRNFVIGSNYININQAGFANAFFATAAADAFTDNYFIGTAFGLVINTDGSLPGTTLPSPNFTLNGAAVANPYNNFYGNAAVPFLAIAANPSPTSSTISTYTTGFSANLLSFTASTPPPGNPVLSGAPMQAPVNFTSINKVNKFDKGDMVARLDLYSGDNVKNKEVQIEAFNVHTDCNITLSLNTLNGTFYVYVDGVLVSNIAITPGAFYSSYYLNNNFGIGMPYISNIAATILGNVNYNAYAQNYTISDFVAYNKALTQDEVRFEYLQNEKINSVNFDIPQGTRNNTDTAINFNKLNIPGRKNNNIRVYIKNLVLSDQDKYKLNGILLQKLGNVLPINTANVEFAYINE